MSTYVMPLPGGNYSPTNVRPTMDDLDGLINHINTNACVQEMLSIDVELGYGVYRDKFFDYYVCADFSYLTWAEVLNRPSLEVVSDHMWGQYEPTPEDIEKFHARVKELLGFQLTRVLGRTITKDNIEYRVRKKGKRAQVFKVFLK